MNKTLCALVLAGLAGFAFTLPSHAAECSTTVEGNDAMQYNTDNINIPASCKTFEVTLKHTGQLPVTVMGHNMVITKTDDIHAVDAAGTKAGADNEYVPQDDPRVIAHSDLVGGGESTTFSIPVAKLSADGKYSFFCSFPGHVALMKGTITLVK